MAHETAKPVDWLSSDEARKLLGISSCELMHLRESGHLPFKKRGSAFLYSAAGVRRLTRSVSLSAEKQRRGVGSDF
jgi:hypothetical protein